MIESVIYEALKADNGAGGVWTLLPVYEGAEKAIFTGGIPDNAPFPCIVITANGGSDFGTREKEGATAIYDIQCFDDKSRTTKEFRALVRKVRKLLNRHDLMPWITTAGFINCGCIADPPANTNEGMGFPGYTIRVRVQIIEA